MLISKRSERISWFHWQFCIGWGSPLRIPTSDDHATLQWKQLFPQWRFPHYRDFHTSEISTLYWEVEISTLLRGQGASTGSNGNCVCVKHGALGDDHATDLSEDQRWSCNTAGRWSMNDGLATQMSFPSSYIDARASHFWGGWLMNYFVHVGSQTTLQDTRPNKPVPWQRHEAKISWACNAIKATLE